MSRSYDIPKIVVKLSGADVMEVGPKEELEAAGIEIEFRQYHQDFQDDGVVFEEDWPHLAFTRVEPLDTPKRRKKT